MEDIEILLSNEFVEFSKKIATIADKKKQLKNSFEKTFTDFKNNMKSLDDEAKKLQKEFEQWKKEKEKNVGDG